MLVRRCAGAAREIHGIDELTEDIELSLSVRGVPDANRGGIAASGQPRHFRLRQEPLPVDPVHDGHVGRVAGDRAHQPVAPAFGVGAEAGAEQCVVRERGIPNPAVPVVPVADAAGLLREGGGRCRDHAAGRRVRQRLQGDLRSDDPLAAVVEITLCDPVTPPALGALDRPDDLDRLRRRLMRRAPSQHERHLLALVDLEASHGREIATFRRDRRIEIQSVRTRHGPQPVVDAAHPRRRRPVLEAHHELHVHRGPSV